MAFIQLTQQGNNLTHLVNLSQIVTVHRLQTGCAVTLAAPHQQLNVAESYERITGAIAVASPASGGGIVTP